MTLAALICAYHESDERGGPLRATLPLAGRSLVERQARLAASAGANPVIILVERMPPALTAAIDRMRSEGIAVTVARSVADAADAVHPEDRLLLMADGLIADHAHVARLIAAEGAAILTIADHAGDDRFERIDAQSRWAGLAMVDGGMLRHTASMLADWDLQSTLLRRAVQTHARQFAVTGDEAGGHLVVAERVEDLEEAEARIVASAGSSRGNWVSRYLLAPIEKAATRWLMPSPVTPEWLNLGAAALTGLAGFMFTRDWIWAGLVLLLLSTPLYGISERLAALRLQGQGDRSWWRHLMPLLAGLALMALAWSLAETRGWGCLVLAATVIAFQIALRGETDRRELPHKHLLAERKGLIWLLVPFAVSGTWVTGLSTLALYAAGSFFWAQHRVHRPR